MPALVQPGAVPAAERKLFGLDRPAFLDDQITGIRRAASVVLHFDKVISPTIFHP